MVTNLEVDYSSDYYDGGSSSSSSTSPSPPVPDYDDIYRRQGDVPSPGIGHWYMSCLYTHTYIYIHIRC